MEYNIGKIEQVIELFQSTAKPVLLLGAGATVKSGIPLAEDMVEKVAFWCYCKENFINPNDLSIYNEIVKSDWIKWYHKQTWFDSNRPLYEIYPDAIESLKPPQKRKDFFRWILSGHRQPSPGFLYLSRLVSQKTIRNILTTNFDDTIETSLKEHKIPPEIINTIEAFSCIDPNSDYTQIIYLHGSVDLYSDKNIKAEIETLKPKLVKNLEPVIKNHPLVVVGYRGAENSIMKSLLKFRTSSRDSYRKGIFWCVREPFDENKLTAQLKTLATNIQDALIFIPIKDFDSCMENLWNGYAKNPNNSIISLRQAPQKAIKNDFDLISSALMDELNIVLLEQKLIAYAQKMSISIPETVNYEWVVSQGIKNNLLRRINDVDFPTFAGYILFASSVRKRIFNSKIIIRINKDQKWLKKVFPNLSFPDVPSEKIIEGNLWEILDDVLDFLKNFNRQYLLKGDKDAQKVSQYHPNALRELIVNAIVHRDYKNTNPIQINISRDLIEIINPGGIVDEVINELKDESLEHWIKSGKRGAKGYRNPVIADLFYGSGKMEKEGSGLSDAWKVTNTNNANITFGQDDDNSNFIAKLFSRNDIIDEVTDTALPKEIVTTNYISNILHIEKLPKYIYTASTFARKPADVYKNIVTDWCPPFILNSELIISFFQFGSKNPLTHLIDLGTVERFDIDDFGSTEDRNKIIVRLLNMSFVRYFESKGLWVDKKIRRSYFIKGPDDKDVSVTYFSMYKHATRLVTRKRVSPITNEIKYWEHKSFKFQIENVNGDWLIFLNPGYVFTNDGKKNFLEQQRHTRLATKRISKDYNLSYLRDLFFWKWIVLGGENTAISIKTIKQLSTAEEEEISPESKLILSNAFLSHQQKDILVSHEREVLISDLLQVEDEVDDNEE